MSAARNQSSYTEIDRWNSRRSLPKRAQQPRIVVLGKTPRKVVVVEQHTTPPGSEPIGYRSWLWGGYGSGRNTRLRDYTTLGFPQNNLTSHRRITILAMTGPGQGSLLRTAHPQGPDSIGPEKRSPIKRDTTMLTSCMASGKTYRARTASVSSRSIMSPIAHTCSLDTISPH